MYKKNIEIAETKYIYRDKNEIDHWRRHNSKRATNRKAHESCGITWRQGGKYWLHQYRYEYYAMRRSFKRARKQLMRNLRHQLLED